MRKWTIILIAIVVVLLIFILVFNNYDVAPATNNYSQMEIQMRKLWY